MRKNLLQHGAVTASYVYELHFSFIVGEGGKGEVPNDRDGHVETRHRDLEGAEFLGVLRHDGPDGSPLLFVRPGVGVVEGIVGLGGVGQEVVRGEIVVEVVHVFDHSSYIARKSWPGPGAGVMTYERENLVCL